jgi:hypothetical protein
MSLPAVLAYLGIGLAIDDDRAWGMGVRISDLSR